MHCRIAVVAAGLTVGGVASAQPQLDAVVSTDGAGARYGVDRTWLHVDLEGVATPDRQGATVTALVRFTAVDLDHTLVAGVGLVRASADVASPDALDGAMITRSPVELQRDHRFLSAYIHDTVRFIRGLDVTVGFVAQRWSYLGGDSTITYGSGPSMSSDRDTSPLFMPTVSATGHLGDSLEVVAQSIAGVREIGPDVNAGRISLRARAFDAPILGRGIASEASVQPLEPLVLTAGYLHSTAADRAIASVSVVEPRVITLTARADTDAHVDAIAVRRVTNTVAAFIGVDNLFDRHDTQAAPRLVHAGLRGAL